MTWRRQQQRPRRGRQEKATATVKTIECCRSIDVGNRNCANAKPLLLRGPQRHSVGTTHDDDGTDQCQCQRWGDLDRYSAGTSRTIYKKKTLVTQKKIVLTKQFLCGGTNGNLYLSASNQLVDPDRQRTVNRLLAIKLLLCCKLKRGE